MGAIPGRNQNLPDSGTGLDQPESLCHRPGLLPLLPNDCSFGATDASFEPGDLAALAFGASFAVGKALHHRANRKRAYDRITPREYECLLWAAEGKTDWEIAAILGVSKPTVAKHILSAREKLGAVTKGHAIAVALRAKILM